LPAEQPPKVSTPR